MQPVSQRRCNWQETASSRSAPSWLCTAEEHSTEAAGGAAVQDLLCTWVRSAQVHSHGQIATWQLVRLQQAGQDLCGLPWSRSHLGRSTSPPAPRCWPLAADAHAGHA